MNAPDIKTNCKTNVPPSRGKTNVPPNRGRKTVPPNRGRKTVPQSDGRTSASGKGCILYIITHASGSF